MSAHCYDLQMEALRKVCQKQLIGSMTAEAVAECSAAADSILDNQLQSMQSFHDTSTQQVRSTLLSPKCYDCNGFPCWVATRVLLYVVNLYHSVL